MNCTEKYKIRKRDYSFNYLLNFMQHLFTTQKSSYTCFAIQNTSIHIVRE
jgi:hypothetical protein